MVQELTQLIIDTSPLVIKSTGVATGMMVAGGIQAVGSIVSGIFGSSAAKKRARAAAREKARLTKKLDSLESSRQAIINPYASSISSQSDLIQDLGGDLTNSYNNLGVATQGAKMQAEEADIALANTLDTLQASGASAGGATALAQAALASKKGVASSIELQEANNEKMKATGAENLQRLQLAESTRAQAATVSEGSRVQGIMAEGEMVKFDTRESREQDKINQTYAQLTGAKVQEAQANRDRSSAITGAISGVASGAGSFAGGLAKKAGMKDFAASERHLKSNIKLVGKSKMGIPIYHFNYKDVKNGIDRFIGTMVDDLQRLGFEDVLIHTEDGILVNYNKIDVDFKKI